MMVLGARRRWVVAAWAAAIVLFLATRLFLLDRDVPPWPLAYYQPIDEFAYVLPAFNLHHYGTWTHQETPYVPVEGLPLNVLQTVVAAVGVALSWTYWGLRTSSVLFGLVGFLAIVAVAYRLVDEGPRGGRAAALPPRDPAGGRRGDPARRLRVPGRRSRRGADGGAGRRARRRPLADRARDVPRAGAHPWAIRRPGRDRGTRHRVRLHLQRVPRPRRPGAGLLVGVAARRRARGGAARPRRDGRRRGRPGRLLPVGLRRVRRHARWPGTPAGSPASAWPAGQAGSTRPSCGESSSPTRSGSIDP